MEPRPRCRGALLAIALVGCATPEALGPNVDAGPSGRAVPGSPVERGVSLPAAPGDFAPAFSLLAPEEEADVERLRDVATCQPCHEDVTAQWQGSAHAFSSFNNPYYRVSIDRLREDLGPARSRFCAGCHDVALLFGGAFDGEIRPEDPRAHTGVTCLVCHGIALVTDDGNGSYVLSTRSVPMPVGRADRTGRVEYDPASVARHRARLIVPPMRTAELCGSCHRGFVDHATGHPYQLSGQDELGEWRDSAFAGSVSGLLDDALPIRDCRSCHMPSVAAGPREQAGSGDGVVSSHRFPGAQTALAAMRGDQETLRDHQEELRQSAVIDVAAASVSDRRRAPADGASVTAGSRLVLDVVLRNVGAGHRFPGGTRDAQDTWVEVTVQDASGTLVAEAGTRHERGAQDDFEAHRLRTVVLDRTGHPALERNMQDFRGPAYDHTLSARDATVVRYGLDVPASLPAGAFPLRVEARLRHRRHLREMQRAACAASRSERGRAFIATSEAMGLGRLDACEAQPVTELAHAVVWLGAGSESRPAEGGAARPLWRRLFEHALGLLGGLSERLDEARPSLEGALADAEQHAGAREQAMVLALWARLAVRQGRTEEAFERLDRASRLLPGHPAIDRLRGQAYAMVWRWPEAARALGRAAPGAQLDDSYWRELAVARGSAGDAEGSLAAALTGLALTPRDESMLLNEALSLEQLGRPGADQARAAYLACRRPDDLPKLRTLCTRLVPGCARERVPVHLHTLRLATASVAEPTRR